MTNTIRWATPFLAATIYVCTPSQAEAHAIVVRPYIQAAQPTGVWILWETEAGEESTVQWGPSPRLGNTATGTAQVSRGEARIHEVELTGLTPQTRYYYQVTTGEDTSEVHHFVTPAPAEAEQPLRIVAMSDMQQDAANPTIYRDIIDNGVIPYITKVGGGDLADSLSMVLIPGDLVPEGDIHSQWREMFFAPSAPLATTVPIYPVLGNHERNNPLYYAYFHLPEGPVAPGTEAWWYTDQSNVRIIGLNSNAGILVADQLDFVEELLADACDREALDFVFVELHHPHLSELWPEGESDYFTAELVPLLDTFSADCGKPAVHFYGHTHGYARGQSREHNHLWIDVATAGGNIDYWGEYDDQLDYEDITVSEDEYGFVVIEVEAGEQPEFRITRINRGDEDNPHGNEVTDRITVRRYNEAPSQPLATRPRGAVTAECGQLEASAFSDGESDAHMATHWQVARTCDDFSAPLVDTLVQSENRYNEVDPQADVSLESFEIIELSDPGTYCWRVRYRDFSLGWSTWSEAAAFEFDSAGEDVAGGCGAQTGQTGTTGEADASSGTDTTATPTSASTAGDAAADTETQGCSCRQTTGSGGVGSAAGWLALLWLVGTRRRRGALTTPADRRQPARP